MRKFRLLFAVVLVVGLYSCNNAATTDGTETGTPADTTQTTTGEEDHTDHDH